MQLGVVLPDAGGLAPFEHMREELKAGPQRRGQHLRNLPVPSHALELEAAQAVHIQIDALPHKAGAVPLPRNDTLRWSVLPMLVGTQGKLLTKPKFDATLGEGIATLLPQLCLWNGWRVRHRGSLPIRCTGHVWYVDGPS